MQLIDQFIILNVSCLFCVRSGRAVNFHPSWHTSRSHRLIYTYYITNTAFVAQTYIVHLLSMSISIIRFTREHINRFRTVSVIWHLFGNGI